jgi:hypothetical protein
MKNAPCRYPSLGGVFLTTKVDHLIAVDHLIDHLIPRRREGAANRSAGGAFSLIFTGRSACPHRARIVLAWGALGGRFYLRRGALYPAELRVLTVKAGSFLSRPRRLRKLFRVLLRVHASRKKALVAAISTRSDAFRALGAQRSLV